MPKEIKKCPFSGRVPQPCLREACQLWDPFALSKGAKGLCLFARLARDLSEVREYLKKLKR